MALRAAICWGLRGLLTGRLLASHGAVPNEPGRVARRGHFPEGDAAVAASDLMTGDARMRRGFTGRCRRRFLPGAARGVGLARSSTRDGRAPFAICAVPGHCPAVRRPLPLHRFAIPQREDFS